MGQSVWLGGIWSGLDWIVLFFLAGTRNGNGNGNGIGIGIGIRIGKDLVGLIGLVRMGNDLRTLILRTRAGGV